MLKRALSLAVLTACSVSTVALTPSVVFAQDAAGKGDAKKVETEKVEKTEKAEKAEKEELRRLVEDSQDSVEKILDDMSENLREIEELLKKRDTGKGTVARQKKVLQQLDQLIDEAGKT